MWGRAELRMTLRRTIYLLALSLLCVMRHSVDAKQCKDEVCSGSVSIVLPFPMLRVMACPLAAVAVMSPLLWGKGTQPRLLLLKVGTPRPSSSKWYGRNKPSCVQSTRRP